MYKNNFKGATHLEVAPVNPFRINKSCFKVNYGKQLLNKQLFRRKSVIDRYNQNRTFMEMLF